jgi:Uma2 family endonuclease
LWYVAGVSGAGKTLISPEEYLSMSFDEREPEYVRGELIYKPMPDAVHGTVQMTFGVLLYLALKRLGFAIMSETRSRLAVDNFRLPDIAVFGPNQPFENVPTVPPLVAIEIISKDQPYSQMMQKLEDYRSWGVQHIWTVDPRRRRLAVFTQEGLKDVEVLALPGTEFKADIDQLLKDVPPAALED